MAKKKRKSTNEIDRGGGRIDPTILYSRAEVLKELGLSIAGWNSLIKQGLPAIYISRRVFVFGQDLIEFIRSNSRNKHFIED